MTKEGKHPKEQTQDLINRLAKLQRVLNSRSGHVALASSGLGCKSTKY
jgi:hypothetical protein